MGFDQLSIYRPAVLMCNRTESRPGEAFIRFLMKPIAAVAPTAGSCPTSVLAKAMINNTLLSTKQMNVEIFSNKDIFKLADESYFKNKTSQPKAEKQAEKLESAEAAKEPPKTDSTQ